MPHWITCMKHCFSLPVQNFVQTSLYPVNDIIVDSTNLLSKMKDFIISPFQSDDVAFSPNALFHPAMARIVQGHYMSRYQSAWVFCINKDFNPNIPNKLKFYASFKATFSIENHVSSLPISKGRSFIKLRVSSHHLAIETARYTRPVTPRSQNFRNHCSQYVLGDHMHFPLSCPKFVTRRKLPLDSLEILSMINA